MAVIGEYLPGELISEILLRLPVKSVTRFRCVSKQWQSLISDSEFATLHLHRSKKRRPPSLVIATNNDTSSMLYTLVREDLKSRFKVCDSKSFLPCPPQLDHDYYRSFVYLASCDGILCFSSLVPNPRDIGFEHIIYLVNPVNGELKKLLPFPVKFSYLHHIWIGLGFESVSRDFKVVRIMYYNNLQLQLMSNVSVYSLNSDNWRILEDIPVPVPVPFFDVGYDFLGSSAIVINGVTHWMSCTGKKIYSFDLVHEVRTELPSLPVLRNYLHVYEMGGSQLSVFCKKPEENFRQVEVWVLKETGVQEPWSKRGIIDLHHFDSWNSGLGILWNYAPVIGPWNDDEILLQVNGELVLYSIKNNTKRNLEIDGLPTTRFMTLSFTESLVKLVH